MKRESVDDLDVRRLRRRIEEAGLPAEQRSEIDLILPVLLEAVKFLQARIIAIRTQFQQQYYRRTLVEMTTDPFTIGSERYWAIVMDVGAAMVMIVEALVSAALSRSWFTFQPIVAITVGCVTGLLLSFAAKAGVGVLAGAHNHKTVQSTRRNIGALAVTSFVVNAILVAMIFSTRGPMSESLVDYLLAFVGISLGFLGVTLPILAGSLLALGHDLDWSHRDDLEFQRATLKLAEISGLVKWCKNFEGSISVEQKQAPSAEPLPAGGQA